MNPYYQDDQVQLYHGQALDVACGFADGSVDCIVTSPPYYGLRDYGEEGQYGLEDSPSEYVDNMRALFSELRRVLADDGTLWLNLGDSYSGDRGNKLDRGVDSMNRGAHVATVGSFAGKGPVRKNLLGIPWRVAFALQDDGWILRNAIVWHKPNAMPESVRDRLSSRYEQVFMFNKSQSYWFDLDPIREPMSGKIHSPGNRAEVTVEQIRGAQVSKGMSGHFAEPDRQWGNEKGRAPGDVWKIPTQPFSAAHFAVYPVALPLRCVQAGCKPGGTVLDPFSGSGTTGVAAQNTGRRYVGIDLNREYLDLSLTHPKRLREATLDFSEGA